MCILNNINFPDDFVVEYLTDIFGESFTHSSLSFEKVFNESMECYRKIQEFMSEENCEFYNKLVNSRLSEDKLLLKTRINEINQYLISIKQVPEINKFDEENNNLLTIKNFKKYIPGIVRPYRNKAERIKAAKENKLTDKKYEKEDLILRIEEIYNLIIKKSIADKKASDYKKCNYDAFIYSLTRLNLNRNDIIEINHQVTSAENIHYGFKNTNNEITGAPFNTCPKERVEESIIILLYKYNNDWKKEIEKYKNSDNFDINVYNLMLCEREAKFHIEFERIHPFDDGNGRTGRIILNKHLLDNGLAPIYITPEMRESYIYYINNYDYKNFGIFINILSSVTLQQMVSEYRNKQELDPRELIESEVGETGFSKIKTF